ncbi:MAG: signal recognition particle-docking protein FtsY [Candidatus Delongbacteria bacterium]|nr:signal recognition particle-docking protein FtsY [Candidatus Delongbacteria bacterium]MCG2760112.1 signal recognition particle-docking protein FtsY [Candidatus Delongbacteria bacterium]
MALFKRKRVKDYLEDAEVKVEKQTEVFIETKEGLYDKLSRSLSKTKNNIFNKMGSIFSSEKIDAETLDKLEEALYTSDIGVKTTEKILEEVKKKIKDGENIVNIIELIKEIIIEMLNKKTVEPQISAKPHIILVVGVNGNGKTTTIGKLAYYYKNKGKKVLIGAADTFRAAAIEQLEEWAKRSGADFVKNQMNSDPAAVAYDSYKAGEARGSDIVLIDTAGRLHNKINLMNELEKISRVLKKLNPSAPHEVLLVLDATTGQNALNQAKQFSKTSGVTGIVLSKLDGTARGGVTIAINQEMDIPVKFIGIGEKIEDLQEFDPEIFVRSIFG